MWVDCNFMAIRWLYAGPLEEKMQKLTRWGNSVGIRINAHILASARLKSGDLVYLRLMDSGDIRVRPVKGRRQAESESAKTTAMSEPSELEQW